MNTRQLTLVVTIAAIALVFVGIGYAYTAYTVNNSNSTTIAYVTVTQEAAGDSAAYHFAEGTTIQFDTYNETDSSTVYYKVRNPVTLVNGSNNYCAAKLGNIKLHAAMTGNATLPDTMGIQIADSSGFDAKCGWIYFIADSNKNVIAYKDTSSDTTAWTAGNTSLSFVKNTGGVYDDVTIGVYYGYLPSDNDKVVGTEHFLNNASTTPADDRAPKALSGASITFIASNDFTITYHDNNGGTTNYVQTVTMGTNNLMSFIDTGITAPETKHFIGWALSSTETTNFITSLDVTENKTVYAIYGNDS